MEEDERRRRRIDRPQKDEKKEMVDTKTGAEVEVVEMEAVRKDYHFHLYHHYHHFYQYRCYHYRDYS